MIAAWSRQQASRVGGLKIGDHGMSGGVREDRQQQSSGGGLGVGLRGSAAPPPMASSTASEEDGRIPIWCAMRDEPPWMELTVKLSQLPYLLSGIYSASLFTWSNTPFAALTAPDAAYLPHGKQPATGGHGDDLSQVAHAAEI